METSLIVLALIINALLGCISLVIDEYKKKKAHGDLDASFSSVCKELWTQTVQTYRGGHTEAVLVNGRKMGEKVTERDFSMFIFLFFAAFGGLLFFLSTVFKKHQVQKPGL